MTGLHAALAELAAEWADRTPRSDAPRDRRECAAVLHALLASHVPSGQVDHEQAYRDLRAGVEALVLAAWDDGNATGLDGWIGPERGEEPDPEGIRARERFADHAAALLTSSVPATASEGATEHRLVGEIGRQACTCGWEPALGTSVWREFDKHLLATGVTSSWDHLTGPEQQAVRSLAEDCSKPGSSLENAGSTDGDREGLSDERRELLPTLALADGQDWRGWVNTSEHTAEMMYGRQADAVERILAARLAEVTAERDEARAEVEAGRRAGQAPSFSAFVERAGKKALARASEAEARVEALAEQVAAVEDLAARWVEGRVRAPHIGNVGTTIRAVLTVPGTSLAVRDAKVAAQTLLDARDEVRRRAERDCGHPGLSLAAAMLDDMAHERAAGGEVGQP